MDVCAEGSLYGCSSEDGALDFGEDAEIFLGVPIGAHFGSFPGEPSLRDARALFGGDGDGGPVFVGLDDEGMPAFIEEAALTVGRGEHPGFAAGDGEGGPEGGVGFVRDAGGFINEEEFDAGVAARGGFAIWNDEDAGAVAEFNREAVCSVVFRVKVQLEQELAGFADEFSALLFGGADDDDQAIRFEETHVDCHGCGNGGFAPLAGAVEDAVFVFGAQDLGLDVVWDEAQFVDGPLNDVGFRRAVGVGLIEAESNWLLIKRGIQIHAQM